MSEWIDSGRYGIKILSEVGISFSADIYYNYVIYFLIISIVFVQYSERHKHFRVFIIFSFLPLLYSMARKYTTTAAVNQNKKILSISVHACIFLTTDTKRCAD